MITLALALLLSQVTPSLSSRVQHDVTGEGFLAGWGYAQVPAVTCTQYPNSRTNLLLQSQSLTTSPWLTTSTGVAAPTVTADIGADPLGFPVAERLQVPACPTVGHRSVLYQGVSSGVPLSNLMAIRTNVASTAQTVTLCSYGTLLDKGTCTPCTAPGTGEWVKCLRENYVQGPVNYMLIGCTNDTTNYYGATNTGAADVLVTWGQIEATTTSTPYIPTTTTTATAAPGCYSDGLSAAQSCVQYASSRTNSARWSNDVTQGVWSTSGSTPSAPTLTHAYSTTPTGLSADRLQLPAVTAGQNNFIAQSLACPVGTARMSVTLRGTSGSGNACLWSNDAASASNCAFGTSWTTCSVATAGTASSIVFGNLGSIAGCIGANGAQDVLVGGFQCEAGTFVTTLIPTQATPVTVAPGCY